MGIFSKAKAILGFKKPGRLFSDEDRDTSATVRSINAERKELEWEAEKLKLKAKIEDIESQTNEPVDDLHAIVREAVEDVLDEQGKQSDIMKLIPLIPLLTGQQQATPVVQNPQWQATPPIPVTPSPPETPSTPEPDVSQDQIKLLIDFLPDQLIDEIEHIPKENYIAISKAVWEKLNSPKP